VEIQLPPHHPVGLFEAALEPLGGAVTSRQMADGGWSLVAHCPDPPRRGELAARLHVAAVAAHISPPGIRIDELSPTDWVADYQQRTKPLKIGGFYIYPSHSRKAVPDNSIGIKMDAGLAFGTGEHETTEGCLLALEDLHGEGKTVASALDMGCGTGILAIAMARLWRATVLAADVDAVAVRLAAANAVANGLAKQIRTVACDGYASPVIAATAPFDLIAANILARPLIGMAPHLARHLAPGGAAVLSGLLGEQEDEVLAAHCAHGLRPGDAIRLGEWTTLVLRADG
jgi:ribosomal protein L11 methyltransferase